MCSLLLGLCHITPGVLTTWSDIQQSGNTYQVHTFIRQGNAHTLAQYDFQRPERPTFHNGSQDLSSTLPYTAPYYHSSFQLTSTRKIITKVAIMVTVDFKSLFLRCCFSFDICLFFGRVLTAEPGGRQQSCRHLYPSAFTMLWMHSLKNRVFYGAFPG